MGWVQTASGAWINDGKPGNIYSHYSGYPGHSSYGQVQSKYIYLPYEGFNRKKWPNTFKCLLLLYTLPEWSREGKWVNWGYPEGVG